jgi:hypothetical protein
MVCIVALASLGACSLVLDPDELEAELADGMETIDADSGANETDVLATDDAAGPRLVVDHSGAVSCTFDNRIALTQCPETCQSGGWRYVVDASRSAGVGSFAWTFEATGGFRVSPAAAAGARVELRIDVPECLIGGTDVKPFTVLARVSLDGGPPALVELPAIRVALVQVCSGAGACEAP